MFKLYFYWEQYVRNLYEEALAEHNRIRVTHEKRVYSITVRARFMMALVIALGLLAVFA